MIATLLPRSFRGFLALAIGASGLVTVGVVQVPVAQAQVGAALDINGRAPCFEFAGQAAPFPACPGRSVVNPPTSLGFFQKGSTIFGIEAGTVGVNSFTGNSFVAVVQIPVEGGQPYELIATGGGNNPGDAGAIGVGREVGTGALFFRSWHLVNDYSSVPSLPHIASSVMVPPASYFVVQFAFSGSDTKVFVNGALAATLAYFIPSTSFVNNAIQFGPRMQMDNGVTGAQGKMRYLSYAAGESSVTPAQASALLNAASAATAPILDGNAVLNLGGRAPCYQYAGQVGPFIGCPNRTILNPPVSGDFRRGTTIFGIENGTVDVNSFAGNSFVAVVQIPVEGGQPYNLIATGGGNSPGDAGAISVGRESGTGTLFFLSSHLVDDYSTILTLPHIPSTISVVPSAYFVVQFAFGAMETKAFVNGQLAATLPVFVASTSFVNSAIGYGPRMQMDNRPFSYSVVLGEGNMRYLTYATGEASLTALQIASLLTSVGIAAAVDRVQAIAASFDSLAAGLFKRTSSKMQDPVDSATGAFTYEGQDLTTPGRGVRFDLTRSYSSLVTAPSVFGRGWGHNHADRVAPDAATGAVQWSPGSGGMVVFTSDGLGGFVSPPGVLATLAVVPGGGWRLSGQDLVVSLFDGSGRLVSRVDRSGQGLAFVYDVNGRLSTVTDAAGRVHTFTYGVSGVSAGLLTRVASSDGRLVRYGYGAVAGANRLVSFTDERLKVSSFAYDAGGFLTKITDPLGNVEATNVYDSQGRVVSQADALAKVSSFVWDDVAEKVTMTDAVGAVTTHDYGGYVLDGTVTPAGTTSTTYSAALDTTGFTDLNGKQWTATYDARGNMLTRTGPTGLVESWTYDGFNNPLTATDTTGVVTTFTYDTAGRVASQTTGVSTRLWVWNTDGTLTSETDPLGHTTTYTYDSIGQRISMTTVSGAVTTWTYDTAGRVVGMVPPRGNVAGANPAQFDTQYRYDKAGNVTMVIEPAGRITRYVYDDAGRLVTVTAPDQGVTTYGYNAAGETTTVTGPDGGVTSIEYSDRGEKTKQTDPTGGVTTWAYDGAGRVVSMVEPLGNVVGGTPADYGWSYGYDGVGRRVSQTDPLGRVTTWVYDALGRMTGETRPDGTTTTSFDSALQDRRVTVTDQAGRTSVTVLSPERWLVSSTDPKGLVTWNTYDNAGNRLTTTGADGAVTSWVYDIENRVASTVDPRGNIGGANPADFRTTYGYDIAGNRTSVTDPLGRVTTSTFDVADRTDIVTDPAGRVTNYTYDLMSRVRQVNGTSLGATKYGYDTAGLLRTRTDALLKVTSYDYDLAHRLVKQTDPLGRYVTYGYDVNGQRTQMVDAVVNSAANPALGTTTFTYDRLGRTTGRSFSDGTPAVGYSYDAAGRRSSMADGTGTVSYGFDTANRVTSVTNGAGVTMTYGYDPNSNITALNTGSGSFTRSFDSANRLTGVTDGSGSVVTYTYDVAGLPTGTLYPGGTAQNAVFDQAGQLSSLTNTANSSLLRSYTFTRDTIGSPTRIDTTGPAGVLPAESELFDYDAAGRLRKQCWSNAAACTGANQTVWVYDQLGRRVSEKIGTGTIATYGYDAADQLLTVTQGPAVTTYGYNPNGDQTAAGLNSSAFNTARQTKTVTTPAGTVTYGYDGDSNRVASTVGAVTTRFDWDTITDGLANVTAETVGASIARTYAYGNALARITTGTTQSTPFADPVGTLTHLISPSGTLQAAYLTGSYGAPKTTTVTDPAVGSNPIRYTGQYTDPTTNNIYLRARNYNTGIGSFTQQDPLPSAGSPYAYANNNPNVYTDPTGLISASDVGQFVKGAGGAAILIGVHVVKCSTGPGMITCPIEQAKATIANIRHEGVVQGINLSINPLLPIVNSGVACAYGYDILQGRQEHKRAAACGKTTFNGALLAVTAAETVVLPSKAATKIGRAEALAEEAGTMANIARSESGTVYRTGSRTDAALTDPTGVSFRDSISSSADRVQAFKVGDKIYGVDTAKLPPGSVIRDGVPDGHVSIRATPAQIRAAVVDDPNLSGLGLKKMDDGSYRLPK